MYSSYSFLDLVGAVVHPMQGQFVFNGAGVGEITVEMLTEKTAHNVAADGSVMVSKIAGNNGQVSIQVQQTSDFHQWLLDCYNASLYATTDVWAGMSATFRNIIDGSSHYCRGMSFQKLPNKPYSKEGQLVTWILMAAHIDNENA